MSRSKQFEFFPEDDIPTSIRILHRTFDLVERDMNAFASDRHYGLMDAQNSKIEYLNRSSSDTADTILHEILHALYLLFDLGDDDEQEEHIVRALATGLVTVMRDNPTLFPVLQKIALT